MHVATMEVSVRITSVARTQHDLGNSDGDGNERETYTERNPEYGHPTTTIMRSSTAFASFAYPCELRPRDERPGHGHGEADSRDHVQNVEVPCRTGVLRERIAQSF